MLYEFATALDENPDVIGWATAADSVLIECKLTRSDFLRDAEKPVRRNPRTGMGRRRYYLCPAEVIQVKDLPPKWGLLWVTGKQVDREARGQGTSRAQPRGRSALPQFDAAARPDSDWRAPVSEWLRGENRLEAKRGVPPNHSSPNQSGQKRSGKTRVLIRHVKSGA